MKEVRDVKEIVFRKDLYPRMQTDPVAVQRYANDLAVLPPIEVNQHNELIDGRHRWTAHKKANGETIAVTVTHTESEAHFLELAIERNAKHGLQLSLEDKKDMARRIYNNTPVREREAKKRQLAHILSVSERTVRDWLSRIDKDSKEARDKKIFELWLACHTQQEIAGVVGCSQQEIAKLLPQMASLPDVVKPPAQHLTNFDPPLYNVWKQAEGKYSEDPSDLANMPLDEFTRNVVSIIRGFARKLANAHIALIIQPTQWKAPERQYTDHVLDIARAVKLPIEMRYSVPYESQQCTAQMVEWAKAQKHCLVLTREIVVWRV